MEHQLGRVNIVAWQSRRLRDPHRANAVINPALTTALTVSAALLLLRFVAQLPLPLELLQIAFATFAACGALLLMRRAVDFIRWLQER